MCRKQSGNISWPLALLLLLWTSAGCEKNDVPKQQPTYEISYSGEPELGEPLTFQSTAPAGATYLWEFNDGNFSSQQTPTYTYYTLRNNGADIADDTVTLIVNSDIYRPSYKIFRLKPGVSKVTGTRVWRWGKFITHGSCCPGASSHALNDTTFGVTKTDDYTVKVWGVNLKYLADSNYYSNERSAGWYNATTLIYRKDTMYFIQRTGLDTSWGETVYAHKF